MYWEHNHVKNKTGDGNLHRWYMANLKELLNDYEKTLNIIQ